MTAKLDVNALIAEGWAYRDLPGKLSLEMWGKFIGILGDAPYKILIGSEGRDRDGFEWRRGQFLLSPAAMENLKAYNAAAKADPSLALKATQ